MKFTMALTVFFSALFPGTLYAHQRIRKIKQVFSIVPRYSLVTDDGVMPEIIVNHRRKSSLE